MKQQDYLEIIELNKGKHRPSLETMIEGRKNELFNYNPLPVVIATDDTNLPLMNIARTYGWIKQDATKFYESEANNVTDITKVVVNTFINTHTQETIDTPHGTFTLDLWYDKGENKWYDTTGLIGKGDFTLTNISFETIYPNKSQDGETANLYEPIDWANIEHFNEFEYFTSVTSIGDSAFRSCSSLTSVTIPNNVTSIGEFAFAWCESLTNVTIPDSVTSIGSNTFYGCSGLTNVTIGNSVTSIGNTAFGSCHSLTSVTIPDSVTSIGDSAFYICNGLTNIIIGNGVTSIGKDVFWACHNLTNVTIGSSVTSIGDTVFHGCNSLTNIVSLATTAPTITSSTFQNSNSHGTLTVPSGSNYSSWMSRSSYYLGFYGWTKVEQ